jgi:hypothetical protein
MADHLPSPVNRVPLGMLAESIACGMPAAAQAIAGEVGGQLERRGLPIVAALDGAPDIPYRQLAENILSRLPGVSATVLDVRQALKTETAFTLGGCLADSFDPSRLTDLQAQLQQPGGQVTLIIGPGAALSGLLEHCHMVIYADQIQSSGINLCETPWLPKVLEAHKRQVLSVMSGYLAWKPPQDTLYLPRRTYEALAARLAVSPMLLRPNADPVLQGWVAPEAGSLLVDWGGECLLELPFENVLWQAVVPILGQAAARLTRGRMPAWRLDSPAAPDSAAGFPIARSLLEVDQPLQGRTEPEDSFQLLTLTAGQQIEIIPAGSNLAYPLGLDESALLPACLGGYTLRSADGRPCTVTRAMLGS